MTRPPYRPPSRPRAAGFTLVEAVIVLTIVGIIGAIVGVFIRAPILGYRDTVERAETTDQADLALRRMARDIRLALPNSVRVATDAVTGDSLELLMTRNGGRYLGADEAGAPANRILSFDDNTATSFAAVAPPPSFTNAGTPQVRVGDFVVVYNLGPSQGQPQSDAYNVPGATGGGNIAAITAIGASEPDPVLNVPVIQITLGANPFARQDTPMPSPSHRFQVVSGPVSFYCTAASDGTFTLWRAWGYPIKPVQAVPAGGSRAVIANRLTTCKNLFNYDANMALQRSGLVVMTIEMRGRNADSGAIRLVNQVHVDNTP